MYFYLSLSLTDDTTELIDELTHRYRDLPNPKSTSGNISEISSETVTPRPSTPIDSVTPRPSSPVDSVTHRVTPPNITVTPPSPIVEDNSSNINPFNKFSNSITNYLNRKINPENDGESHTNQPINNLGVYPEESISTELSNIEILDKMENYDIDYKPKYDDESDVYDSKAFKKLEDLIFKLRSKLNVEPNDEPCDIEEFNKEFKVMLTHIDNHLEFNMDEAKIIHKDLNRYLELMVKMNEFKEYDVNTYKNILNSYKHILTSLPIEDDVNSYYTDLSYPNTDLYNRLNVPHYLNLDLNLNNNEKSLNNIFNIQKSFNPNLSEVLTFENTAEFNNFFKYLILKQQQIFEDYPNYKQLHMDIH